MRRKELKELLGEINLRLSKGRSQHVLIDENVLNEQIRLANVRDTDVVLEVGAGPGFLTAALAVKAKRVISVENDLRFKDYLETVMPENVELIFDDILELDLPEFDKVVANIPYKISSPIIFKLLAYEFTAAVLMFQYEFAKRMVAGVGSPDYSRLSVKIYSKAHCEILRKVSRSSFYPVPKVDSAIVELVPRQPSFIIESEEIFEKVVDSVFNQKRKKIKNAILNKHKWFKVDKEKLKPILSTLDYGDLRGEQLSPEELAELANQLFSKIN